METQAHFVLRRAASRMATYFPPFQYYAEAGEQIYALDIASHRAIGKLIIHFDSNGKNIAETYLTHDKQSGVELDTWRAKSRADWETMKYEDVEFVELLLEMHLMATNNADQLYRHSEISQLQSLSKSPPVIIGGCGRSGTTLLLSILGAHPQIFAFEEELYAFYPAPFRLQYLLDELAKSSRREWSRWCEKTPKNVRVFKQIHDAFKGEVRLIHVVRDGRDVVSSRHPNDPEGYYISPERWVADVGAGLAEKSKTLLVRYEDLVQDTESSLVSICDFIGEEYDDRLLNFENHTSVRHNKAWTGKTARPLHTNAIGRWRDPEHSEQIDRFMNTPQVKSLMSELGYL